MSEPKDRENWAKPMDRLEARPPGNLSCWNPPLPRPHATGPQGKPEPLFCLLGFDACAMLRLATRHAVGELPVHHDAAHRMPRIQ